MCASMNFSFTGGTVLSVKLKRLQVQEKRCNLIKELKMVKLE